MPLVTILLTCYNHLDYLPAALEGVRAQTFRDYEIIALDDGSTDKTREYLSQQTDLKCIFNPKNLGTYGTLNEGLKHAQGEYIAVLNDDDLWAPQKLEKQVALLDANPKIGLVHTEGWFIDAQGLERQDSPLGFNFPRFDTGDILLGLVYENKIIASAALARRSCFQELGGFNSEYFGSGDWEMWFRIAEAHWVGCINEPLTFYRVHGANASHKLERIWLDDEKLRRWMAPRIENLQERFPLDDLKRAQAHNLAALGTVCTLNGHPKAGRAAYAKSLRLMPTRLKSVARYLATYLPARIFRKLL